MLKLYRPRGSGYTAQDVDSWDLTWSEGSITDAVRWAATCHLRPIFDRYFPRSGKILEGGCGLGQYIIHYRALGYDIEGVDFSPGAVSRLKAFDPSLPVRLADVTRLPYDDGVVRCYYSGGVVEHFEEGPQAALKEARRVLDRHGRLLITVPYVNWIRRAQSRFGVRGRWWDVEQVVLLPRARPSVEPAPAPELCFAEYVFDKEAFIPFLDDAGFTVESVLPCDLEWGEVGQFLYRSFGRGGNISPESSGQVSGSNGAGGLRSRARRVWKELFVLEQPTQPWLNPLMRLLTSLSGHMLLFVARPS